MNGSSNNGSNNGNGQKYSRGESFSTAALMNKQADHVFDAPGGIAFRLNPDGYGKASTAEKDRVASFVNEWINREKDPASDVPGAPPLFGQDVAPHAMTFASKIGSQAKTYLPSDESLEANPNDALLMRKDLGIMECLEIRQRMSALLDWSIVPEDTKSPAQKSIAAEITKIIKRIKRFTEYKRCLMDAIWIGRSAIQHTYGHGNVGGKMYCYPRAKHADATGWKHIHGDKVVFRYDDGEKLPVGAFPDQMGIRVSPVIQKDSRIRKIQDLEYTNSGAAIFLSPAERQTVICHKHMIEDAEYQNPRKAGRIHGVGIRDRIYNEWFLKQEILGFLMEYMERSAGGIEIYEYPSGDIEAKKSVMEAAKNRMAFGRNQIFFPKPLGMDSAVYDLRIVEPGFAGMDMLLNIQDKYFGHRIKRYIIGQTLSTEADATGLGSSVADFQKDSLAQIVMYDSNNLQETQTHELVRPIQLANWPETESWQFEMKHELESDNVKEKLDGYRTAWEMGLGIPEKDVAEAIGVSLDNPNEKILKNAQAGAAPGMANGMQFPAGTGFGNQIDAAHEHVKAAGEVRGLKDGVIDHVAGKIGEGGGGAGGGGENPPSSPAVNQDQYARQMSLWDEEEHPRDGEGKFVDKESEDSKRPSTEELSGHYANYKEELKEPKKNTGPGGLTKGEAILQAKKGSGETLDHKSAVRATFLYTGTSPKDWSAVPVSGMAETTDESGKSRMAPEFDFPKGYQQIETPWSGDKCCHLCGTGIKNAFHIQNDQMKSTMVVGSECVTHFGEGDNGEKAAKKSIAAANRDFVKELQDAMNKVYEIGGYKANRHDHSTGYVSQVREWAKHTPHGRKAKELYENIRGTLRHKTGEDIRDGENRNGPLTTDRVIANWRKLKGTRAEELLQEASDFLAEHADQDQYQRRSSRLLDLAASSTHTSPTPAQREAGNYAKGIFPWKGLEIAIENPKGSVRTKTSPSSGREWSREMASHYGYFRRTSANDGDNLDVFIGNHPDSDFVLVIKQVDQDGEFDEFKVVVGCLNRKEAKKLYLANYPTGWKCGPAASMTVDLFKKWVANGGPMRAKSLAKVEKYSREFNDSETDDSAEKNTLISEILQHFYGDSAPLMLDDFESENDQYQRIDDVDYYSWVRRWDEEEHPRNKAGKFTKKGSAENTAVIHSAIDDELKTGERSPASAKRLVDHLGGLSVKELHELKKKYGVSASGVKAELIEKIAKRLDSGRRADHSKNPETISNYVDNKIDEGEKKVDTPDVGQPVVGAEGGGKKDQGKGMSDSNKSIKKVGGWIEVECKYESALHKWVRSHGYKWDAEKKIWWKGYTEKEMSSVESEYNRINNVISSIKTRVEKAKVIQASYDDTIRVKDKLGKIQGVFYADKAWRADSQESYEAAMSIIKAAKPQPKPAEKPQLAEGEKQVSVSKDRRVNFVGSIINVGKDKVPHICVREVKVRKFTDGLSFGMGRDDGWSHELIVRPLTPEELTSREKQLEIKKLENHLKYYTGPLDDDRDFESHAEKAREIRAKLEQMKNG